MKYFKALVCVILVATIFSGCSFRLASSVNDLISPLSPFGDNADVQSAMNQYITNGYTLKNPSGGEYKTSYSFYDIDGDKVEEAITFYEPKDNLGEIKMAVIKNNGDGWNVVENIKGIGNNVYSVDFRDVNGDGKTEVVVCWDVISNSTNHIFSVYKIDKKDDKIKLSMIGDQISVNNYIFFDYNNDGVEEVVLFEISSGNSTSAKAELYSLRNNSYKYLGETKLDSHITSYSSLQIEKAENDIRVYADAIGSDGSSMLTEIIYWSDSYSTIISPFYSYSTGRTKGTSRKAMIECMDINGDDLLEIPLDDGKKMPKSVDAINWKIYKNTTLQHKAYSLLVDDNYLINIPDDYFKGISVKYDDDTKELTILNKSSKKEVFTIKAMLKVAYDKQKDSDYTVVMENSGYYYLAKLGDDKDIKITLDYIKDNIKSCQGGDYYEKGTCC